MPTLNENKAFSLPEDSQKREGDEIDETELEALITSASPLMKASTREKFSMDMQSHVGRNSTYALKKVLLQGLKVIYDKLESPDTSESEKKIIVYKLQERAGECTPGFHNGVNAILEGFYLAKNIGDLLYRVRQDIVSRTATQFTDEVHTNNRFFMVAESEGYGVYALNKDDIYRGDLPDDEIKTALKSAFEKGLLIFPMLQGLEDQLRGQLGSAGYEGPKDTTYPPDEQAKIETSLKKLFKNDPAVVELKAAQDALDEETLAKKVISNDVKDALKKEGLSERNIDVFLNPSAMPEILKKQLETRINALSPEKKESLEKIKTDYEANKAAFGTAVRERLTEANQAFETKLFVVKKDSSDIDINEGITDINWHSIKEMLWQGVKEYDYFEFNESEDMLIDMLMNPNASPKDWGMHKTIKTTQDLIQAINYFNPPAQDAQQSLIHHLEQLPQDSKYDSFKSILQSLSHSIVKDEIINTQYSNFLPELKQDIPTLFSIIPFMTSENISECLLDATLRGNLLNYAILKRPQSLSFLLKSMDTLPENITEEALKEFLPDAINSDKDVNELLQHLTPEQCKVAIDAIKVNLVDLIGSTISFFRVMDSLSPEKRTVVFDAIKDNMKNIIESSRDFFNVLPDLLPEQYDAAIDAIKVIESSSDFHRIMELSSPERRTDVFNVVKGDLRGVIKSSHDFCRVITYLSPDQCRVVCDAMKGDIANIIQKEGVIFFVTLNRTLDLLSLETVTAVYKAIEDDLIKSSSMAFSALAYPESPEQQTALFNAIEAILPSIIKSGCDFEVASRNVSSEQRTTIFNAMESKFPNIIKSGSDFEMIMRHLSPEQRTTLFDAMKSQLPHMIDSGEDFGATMEYLSPEQRTTLFNAMESQLPSMIKSGFDVGLGMVYLSPERYEIIFNKIRAVLPNVINSPEEVMCALSILPLERCSDVVNAIKSEFQNFIKSIEDFNELIENIECLKDEEKVKLVIESCEGILHQAFLEDKFNLFEMLIDRGVRPTHDTITQICSTDNAFIIKALVDKGIVEPQDIISSAGNQKNIGLIQHLLTEKIITPTNTMLRDAYQRGDVALFKALSSHLVLTEGLLSQACKEGKTEIVEILIDKGLKPEKSMLNDAYHRGNMALFKVLSSHVALTESKLSQIQQEENYSRLKVILKQYNDSDFRVEINPGTTEIPGIHLRVETSDINKLRGIKKALEERGLPSTIKKNGNHLMLVIQNIDHEKINTRSFYNGLTQLINEKTEIEKKGEPVDLTGQQHYEASKEAFSHDATIAVKHLQSAIQLGYTKAYGALAIMHLNGKGVSKDPIEAEKLLKQGVEHGHPGAMYNLAIAYEKGDIRIEKNNEQALDLYQRARDNFEPDDPDRQTAINRIKLLEGLIQTQRPSPPFDLNARVWSPDDFKDTRTALQQLRAGDIKQSHKIEDITLALDNVLKSLKPEDKSTIDNNSLFNKAKDHRDFIVSSLNDVQGLLQDLVDGEPVENMLSLLEKGQSIDDVLAEHKITFQDEMNDLLDLLPVRDKEGGRSVLLLAQQKHTHVLDDISDLLSSKNSPSI